MHVAGLVAAERFADWSFLAVAFHACWAGIAHRVPDFVDLDPRPLLNLDSDLALLLVERSVCFSDSDRLESRLSLSRG